MAAGNSSFSTFVTSTIEKYRPKLIENLMGHQALFWQLKQRGLVVEESGSRSIVQPIMYGENSTVAPYRMYDLLDNTPQQGISAAEYDWKFYAGSVSISGEEEFKNSAGKSRIFSLLESKIRQLELSFKLDLNSDLFGDGTASSGKVLTGLAAAVEDGAAWSTYGGIDSSDADNTWWRNQFLDFDGTYTTFNTASGASIEGLAAMRNMVNNCTFQSERPTLIVTTQALFELYEQYLEGSKQRLNVNGGARQLADAGFGVLEFKGIPIVWDEDCDTDNMIFLNSNFLKLVIGSGRNFSTTPFMKPDRQDARVAHTLFAGNIVTSKRDQHGRITDFN